MTTTIISPKTQISGRVSGAQPVQVFGTINGEIELHETLTLEEMGVIEASLDVDNLVVRGTLTGDIRVQNHLYVAASGRISGRLQTHLLTIEDGAQIKAEIETHVPAKREFSALQQSNKTPSTKSRTTSGRQPTAYAFSKPSTPRTSQTHSRSSSTESSSQSNDLMEVATSRTPKVAPKKQNPSKTSRAIASRTTAYRDPGPQTTPSHLLEEPQPATTHEVIPGLANPNDLLLPDVPDFEE